MRAMPVVVMQPGKQLGVALLGIEIGADVDPLAESGLDESLGFAVGAGSVGAGEVVTQAELKDSGAKGVGAITVTVIGEQTANADTEGGVVSHGGEEEGNCISGGEGRQNLGKGNAGMVVNGDVKVFPTAVMLATAAAIGTNLDLGEAAQLLDIEVEQIARSGMLITHNGNGRLQIADAVQTQTTENTADRSPGSGQSSGQYGGR
jgi:hypothetical protein